MTGKQMLRLGTDSAAVNACIPMCFEPIAPLISWSDGWLAEFWYYFADTHDKSIYSPQYYLAFDIPGGKPVKMERMEDNVCCLGSASELFENEYYNRQNLYLEKCAELMEKGVPSEEEILVLQELWINCLPEKFKKILNGKSSFPYHRSSETEKLVYQPKSMMEVLKLEMCKAIKNGDAHEIQRIQNEMTKLMK